jgi:hypothetical protein
MAKFMIVHQATPNWSATRDTAASYCPTCSKAQAPARSVRHALGAIAGCTWSPGLGRARRVWAAPDPLVPADHHRSPPDRQVPYPRRTPILGPRHRSTFWAAHRSAVVSTSNSSSPPASATPNTLNPSSPNNAAVTYAVASPLTQGLLHSRDRLVVTTDREGPRPLNHSFQPGVSPGFPHPLPALLRSTR